MYCKYDVAFKYFKGKKEGLSGVLLYCVCVHSLNQKHSRHLISTTHCPMKSTQAIMEGGKREKKKLPRLISSAQCEFCFAVEPLCTYAYLSLANASI